MRKMRKLVIMVCIAAMIMTNIPNWDAGADVSGTAWSETGDTVVGNACKDYTAHIPILITNNSDFETQAASEEWEGDGTAVNPYIIENYNINASTAHGIDIRNTDVYFIIRNCIIYDGKNNSNDGIYFSNVTNSKIKNVTSYNNSFGIYQYSSSNNNITNCTVYNNNCGISLYYSSNTTLTNCTVYNNSCGIFLYFFSNDLGCDYNQITNCEVYNNDEYGIFLDSSSNNEITNCNLSDNWNGIYLSSSSDNTITNCTASNNDCGVYFYSSSDNSITNCTVDSSSGDNIYIFSSSNDNTISNCTVINSKNNNGIYIGDSSGNTIANCDISNDSHGVFLYSSSNNSIINSTITNSTNYDFYLTQNSHLLSLNTTFNKTKVYVGANSTLNVSWYLNVNVTWKNNISAEYANVRIQDNENGTFDENYTTDKTGWIKDIEIQEYTQNQTDNTSFTPHNVTASQGDISSSHVTVVNETKTIELILDHNAPEINDTTISPEQEYTTDENTTVDFKFNVSHPDNNLTLTYYWYLNNTDTLNETEVKNGTENTTTIQSINWSHYFGYTEHGNYTVKVLVSDDNATVSYTWILTVNDINGKPEIEFYYPPKNIILGNNSCVIFNVTASDPDNDVLSYQWTSNGAAVSNENKYIFYAEYNASENAINTYIIEAMVTDVTDEKLSVNHTWTVTVVDWNASYNNLLLQIELLKNALENITKLIGNIPETLLNRAELLENITWLVENITALNMTVLKDKLNQLFTDLENMNVTLEQLNENIARIQGELNNATDKIGTLTTMLEEANATRDDAIDTMNSAISDKEDAENETKTMENKMNNAIEAKNKAEYKLGASVVCGVIGGIIAGFLVSFLLRRKLPKKG